MTRKLLLSNEPYHEHVQNIKNDPPPGKKRITEIWWDPDTEEIVVVHD